MPTVTGRPRAAASAARCDTQVAISVGVDFAASPKNTAACEVHWHAGHALVERVDTQVDDAAFLSLLEAMPAGGRLGLDCPLGWPAGFVSAVRAHHERAAWPTRNRADRSDLLWRTTDRWVRQRWGRWPLSVSTDRIGVTALRAAYLLDAWEAGGGMVDRTGGRGLVVEVYPAVARRVWGLSPVRSVDEVESRVPIRFTDPAARRWCTESDHVFDALVSALVARAAAVGRTERPPADLEEVAAREGWIHVPKGAVDDLLEPSADAALEPGVQRASGFEAGDHAVLGLPRTEPGADRP